jgi:hypothetical protein
MLKSFSTLALIAARHQHCAPAEATIDIGQWKERPLDAQQRWFSDLARGEPGE